MASSSGRTVTVWPPLINGSLCDENRTRIRSRLARYYHRLANYSLDSWLSGDPPHEKLLSYAWERGNRGAKLSWKELECTVVESQNGSFPSRNADGPRRSLLADLSVLYFEVLFYPSNRDKRYSLNAKTLTSNLLSRFNISGRITAFPFPKATSVDSARPGGCEFGRYPHQTCSGSACR